MKFARMKEIIFLLGIFLASAGPCCLTNAQPHFHRDDDDGESLPSPMHLKRGCNTTADCGLNEYCGGQGIIKLCSNCFDCEELKRKQRTNYDGANCATQPTDCGQCNDGYEEYEGICINKTVSILWADADQVPNTTEETQESKSSTILRIAGAIILSAFVLSILLWGAHQCTMV